MRILTTDMQYRVRQGAGAFAAAVAATFGLCAAPAQAQEVVPAVRAPFMQLAMLTGSMMPGAPVALTPAMSISDAETAVVAVPVAMPVSVEDASAAAPTASLAGTDDKDADVCAVPQAAARIDDEQLGRQRGRNVPGGTMLKPPGMSLANGVTLWDELPRAVTPTPRPQQLSNGVNNVQVTRVTYTTR